MLVGAFYACSDPSSPKKTGAVKTTASTPDAVPSTASPSAPAPSGTPSPVPGQGAVTPCTDDEISVTVRTDRDPVPSAAFLRIFIKIKNTSARTCSRDLGADAQEAQIKQGEKRIWSSDDCNALHGTNVVSLAPNTDGQEFFTDWNTTSSSPSTCKEGRALVEQGSYQVFGRLGTKMSAPANFRVS
ncbi:hypothetical protein [Longispora fulva]|uniref:DUF4232 domain-containing protein n=1 Tax=Longispora fulva TaxID=619741 RepID=A0A8J7GWP8_9ACTN|nr:hypothetical protein [Longispora fulva]MBG6139201.1 hypothetical protein [Longispora fulva]